METDAISYIADSTHYCIENDAMGYIVEEETHQCMETNATSYIVNFPYRCIETDAMGYIEDEGPVYLSQPRG